MTTTLGALIADLHELFEQAFDDAELAAIATEVTINDLLLRKRSAPSPSLRLDPRRRPSTRSTVGRRAVRLPRAA